MRVPLERVEPAALEVLAQLQELVARAVQRVLEAQDHPMLHE
jgi:hypothetical protein